MSSLFMCKRRDGEGEREQWGGVCVRMCGGGDGGGGRAAANSSRDLEYRGREGGDKAITIKKRIR